MAETARGASENEVRRLIAGVLPQDNSAPTRRVLLPLRELTRRGLIKGLAMRMDGGFPFGLGDLAAEATLYCPGFLSILSWLDLAQALGHRVIYDITWNPFLIPCNDPRYLLWGDNEGFMQAFVDVLGLRYSFSQLLAEAEARRWELRTVLGRVDRITAPTEALAEQFHADLVPDYVWEGEFNNSHEAEDGLLDLVWRGESWELVGLREIWEPTLEVLQDHPHVRFTCYGPLSDWFLKRAEANGVEIEFNPESDPESMTGDLLIVVHPKGVFYEGLSAVEIMRSVHASQGKASILGTGPLAETFVEAHGGIAIEKGDWKDALSFLIEDEEYRVERRPNLPTRYCEAEGLEILLG